MSNGDPRLKFWHPFYAGMTEDERDERRAEAEAEREEFYRDDLPESTSRKLINIEDLK